MISSRKTPVVVPPGSAGGKPAGSQDTEKRRRKKKPKGNLAEMEFVAPDGGWGWVVAAASGLSSFSILPLGQNFGLIYKEKYEEWGITQAEYSFMRNIEFSVSSSLGLLAGALLRKYGYRKMSLLGGILCTLSYLITSQVSSITNFTLFFSILGGIGSGIAWPANALALNTYFKRRRGIATGLSWTATGLSPVIMPQLITLLMGYTDVHGTVLILAGITLHCIPMALLLQPAHWHGRWVPKGDAAAPDKPTIHEEQKAFLEVPGGVDSPKLRERRASLKRGQVGGIDEEGDFIVDTQSTLGLDVAAPISRQSSVWSLVSARSRPCIHDRLCEDCHRACEGPLPEVTVTDDEKKPSADEKLVSAAEDVATEAERRTPIWKRALIAVVDFFDLTLMKDPKFVSIFIGMTLGFVAEVNFALLVPFIYAEYGFSKDVVALCMSTLAGMDLVTRFTVPFITDRYRMDARLMYSIGLLILATGRIGMAHLSGFKTIMAITLWLGFGKGLRTVFMALVIPSYVPLHRLPTASGLQMMANGIIFICIGPLFGYLRDSSDDYTSALHCLNALNFTMITLWSAEYLFERFCRRRKKEKPEDIT
ncbi:monocarboxylate transporter 14-like [Ischnura elegans]|uniref:monocarboxylate transporter 14-like n=1 Tax=Ischnura elegans TaxID=197161 RepID=UPI001ED89089|nr:monocarboxylate transporter 14-like [Ischnura elegans]